MLGKSSRVGIQLNIFPKKTRSNLNCSYLEDNIIKFCFAMIGRAENLYMLFAYVKAYRALQFAGQIVESSISN